MAKIFSLFAAITSLLASVVILICNHTGYDFIEILPLTYAMSVVVCYFTELKYRNRITVWGFLIISYLRYALCPLLGVLSGSLLIRTKAYSEYAASLTALLMAIELVIATSFLLFCCRLSAFSTKNTNSSQELHLRGSPQLYMMFIMLAIVLCFLLWNRADLKISFIKIQSDTEFRIGDQSGVLTNMVSMLLTTALTVLFLVVVDYFRGKSRQLFNRQRKRGAFVCVVFALVLICIIIGERRSRQIYLTFSLTCVLLRTFVDQKKFILKWILSVSVVVIGLATIYKTFNVFLYDTYATALKHSDFSLLDMAQTLDAYCYGLDTTMRNISFARANHLSFSVLIFDALRSTFGISFFVKGHGQTTISRYNNWLYAGAKDVGYLFSSTGYGYLYFSLVLFYLMICARIIFTLSFEQLMKKTHSLEFFYVWSFSLIVNIFAFYGSISPQINLLSRMIVVFSLIVVCGSMWRQRRYALYEKNSE